MSCAQCRVANSHRDVPKDVLMLARMYQSEDFTWTSMASVLGRTWAGTRNHVKRDLRPKYPRLFPKRDNLGNIIQDYDKV